MINRTLYTLIWNCARPFIPIRLGLRYFRNKAYLQRWDERFVRTLPPSPRPGTRRIWVHTVSVGEVNAAVPMMTALLEDPDIDLLVTTSTPTGSDQLKRQMSAHFGHRLHHVYAPYDIPRDLNRFLDAASPDAAVFMETEVWPNTLHCLAERNIPAMLANARLSEKSAAGYVRFGGLIRPALQSFTAVGAQTDDDARRLIEAGARPDVVTVTGSVKFDITIDDATRQKARDLREFLGDRPIWIAGSTREGEEGAVLQALAKIRMSHENVLLILVPRHPERFTLVAQMASIRGNGVVLRSRGKDQHFDRATVYVADTMGELPMLYAASDVAFVGGSLVETGGQNVLEPAAAGVPVLFGPHTFNFADICEKVIESGAGHRVADSYELTDQVLHYFQSPHARRQASDAAKKLMAENQGASERLVALVRGLLARLDESASLPEEHHS